MPCSTEINCEKLMHVCQVHSIQHKVCRIQHPSLPRHFFFVSVWSRLSSIESSFTDKWQRFRTERIGNHLSQLAQVLGFPCLPPHFLHKSKHEPQLTNRPLMASNTDDSVGSPSMVSTALCTVHNHQADLALVCMESWNFKTAVTLQL